jgi:hypothetical protein
MLKRCSVCGRDQAQDQFAASEWAGRLRCRSCRKVEQANHYQAHSEHMRDLRQKRDRAQLNEYSRVRNVRMKAEAIAQYGGYCVCCGETEPLFLNLEHTDGNGKQHRLEVGVTGGVRFYDWRKKRGWPTEPRLRVMCWNCNCARHLNGGVCPHELGRVALLPGGKAS